MESSRPPHSHHPGPASRERERGVALILGTLFTIVVVGLVVGGAMMLRSHETRTRTAFATSGQAVGFARSGLVETLGWFRKQTSQPVRAFDPILDPAANPPILDTIDPDIGIVREFKISGAIWGRYEVWKDWPADPDPVRLLWRNRMRVQDVSAGRGNLVPGSVWRIRSIGHVFRRVDGSVPFDQPPNHVIAREIAGAEVRRLALQPPGQAALCTARGSAVTVNTRARILGGATAAGIYFPAGTGTAVVAGGVVSGAPPQSATTTYDDSLEAVFGVSLDELRAMASVVVATGPGFPSPVPFNSLVVSETSGLTFDAARPLKGTGVVVVVGDVTILPGSNSAFSGLLYVDGSVTLRAPADIQGAIVCTGTVHAQGTTDYATITYDDGILRSLRMVLGSYRLSGAIQLPRASRR
jgi:hypothetical protein